MASQVPRRIFIKGQTSLSSPPSTTEEIDQANHWVGATSIKLQWGRSNSMDKSGAEGQEQRKPLCSRIWRGCKVGPFGSDVQSMLP